MAKSSSSSKGGREPSNHPGPGGNWPSQNPKMPSGNGRGVAPPKSK